IAAIDERGYLQNPMLARQVTEKLSPHLKSKWCDYAEEYGSRHEPEIITLSRFLMQEADRAVRHAYSTSAPITVRSVSDVRPERLPRRILEQPRHVKVYNTMENSARKTACYCCGAEHKTSRCKKLEDMSVSDRWQWAKETNICYLCLDSKHRRFMCKSKRCGRDECKQMHHVLLHAPPREDNVIAATAHRPENSNEQVLLKGVTSMQREADSQEVDLEVQGEGQADSYRIKARTVKNLTLGSQSIKPEVLQRPYLRKISDEHLTYANAKPRVLIGADNWHLIVTRRLLSRKRNEPAASLTRLGWVLHGTTPR
ncbi:hypothetical protein Cfor_01118, partial [Coptotermes formosanus]